MELHITPPLHFLVTEGGVDGVGIFHKIARMDDSRLAEIFARQVLVDLVRKEPLSPEWAERLLSWRHTGFNVHSRVRAKTMIETERVGKYMIRLLLSLERLSFSEKEGQVSEEREAVFILLDLSKSEPSEDYSGTSDFKKNLSATAEIIRNLNTGTVLKVIGIT